ncbi:CAP domain-containing protein [Bacillus sp. 31A1R]|uniref:CAP domain-containing protein n=1 Tax=Robertmurraya mangrovi TaxID=3098077 RepID=A0ABU5IU38_9BACI|nr:CAP domain-containing protein [Bacillus sp. 31A1R]MDZ5470665.1 CAP domain-containing protein [Bacillus sp. 31A1R]
MRALLRILLLISAVLLIIFYLNISVEDDSEVLVDERSSSPELDQSLIEDESIKQDPALKLPKTGLLTLVGKSTLELEKELGRPMRVDPTYYGYDWWIYNSDLSNYIQVGVADDKVVTVYAIGPNVDITPFKIGQPIERIYASAYIEPNISLEYDGSSYRFELSEADMNTRPLLQMGDVYVQLYFDKFDGILSSIRLLDAETLIKLRPYELVYLGDLLEVSPAEEGAEEEVEKGSQLQILDITNIMRERHQLNRLGFDEKTTIVAYNHSKDMFETEDFSHTSEKYGELSDRLEAGEVFYQLAGENIAANYIDAPAVMEGWLNSKGHRETMLNDKFTHIGVGVYKKHYTQNFIQKWEE